MTLLCVLVWNKNAVFAPPLLILRVLEANVRLGWKGLSNFPHRTAWQDFSVPCTQVVVNPAGKLPVGSQSVPSRMRMRDSKKHDSVIYNLSLMKIMIGQGQALKHKNGGRS